MTAAEQEALFEKVKQHCPKRPARWCSGYVHGVCDEAKGAEPNSVYTDSLTSHYSQGYLHGYADAHGSDAWEYEWAPYVIVIISYRWWERPHAD